MNLRLFISLAAVLAVSACNPGDDNNNNNNVVSFDHEGGTITGGASWAEGTHNVLGSITIESGVLQVAACSVLKMANGATISVTNNGALKMVGRQDCPITVTSSKSVPGRGDWGYLEFYSEGDNGANELTWVVLEYAGNGGYGAIWAESGAGFGMSNTIIRDSSSYGLMLQDGVTLRSFTGNTLTTNTKGPIDLYANDVGQLLAGTYGPNDVDSIHISGGTVSKNQTWLDLGVPYVVAGSVSLTADPGSAILTLSPGVTLRFNEGQTIDVGTNGGLHAVGTALEPITLTSAKSSPAAGDWTEIDVYAGSSDTDNVLEYTVVEYSGNGDYGCIWIEGGASMKITNSTLRNCGGYGLFMQAAAEVRSFTGNILTGNVLGAVALGANEVPQLGLGTYTPNVIEGINVAQSGSIATTGTWKNLGVDYRLPNGLSLNTATGSAHVTVEAGVTLLMGPGQGIDIGENGGLTLAGTSNDHVVITSGKSGPAAGDWGEVDVYASSSSAQNTFTYADFQYGGGASYGQIWVENDAGITLSNATFSFTEGACDITRSGANASITVAAGTTPAICGP